MAGARLRSYCFAFTSALLTLLLLSSPVFADQGSGTAEIVPDSAVIVGSEGTWTIIYVAAEQFITGEVEIYIPTGWTAPQKTDPSLAGYVDYHLSGGGVLYDPPHSISGQIISIWIDTLAAGDSVYVVYGDASGDPEGIATAQTTPENNVEFTVGSHPKGFNALEIAISPTLDVVAGPIAELVFTTPERTIKAGQISDRMIVQAQDTFENPVTVDVNQDISLGSTSAFGQFSALGGGSFTPISTVTIQAGEDTVTFYCRDQLAGTHTITASADGQTWIDAPQDIIVNEADPYRLAVTPDDTTATAGDYVRFTIRVVDEYGNPSPVATAQTCTLYASGGNYYDTGDHVTPVTELDISAGTSSAQIDYMHTAMGNYFLAFSDNDGISPNLGFEATEIDIIPSSPDAATSSVVGDEETVTANGTDELEVTVTVRDEFGNPVEGVLVTIDATDSDGGNSYTQPGATGANGIAIGYLRSTVAETKIVRAYIDGTTQIVDTLSVDFVAGPASLSASQISVDPPSVTADDEDTLTVTVTVLDANGNPVGGSYVTIEATGAGNRYVAPGTTGPDGVAVGYMFSTVAESKTVSFKIGGSLAVNTASAEFIAGPADLTTSGIEADPLIVVADGADTLTVTVTVRDEFGNRVPDNVVTLSASGSGNTIEDPGAPSDSNGEAVGYIFSTVAEPKTIGFSIGGAPAPATVPVDFVAGVADPSVSDIDADPLSVTADGSQAAAVTVTAFDANGNIVSGSTVVITASGIDNTITQPAAPTDENGEAVGYVRSTKAETKTIGFIIDSAPADSTVAVDFLPGDVNYTLSSVEGDRDTVYANGIDTLTVTVTALDANSNPVPGQNVTLEVDPPRLPAQNEIIQPGLTDADGIAIGYVLSTVAEEKYVRALIEGVVTGQVTVLFLSDEADPNQSEVSGDKSVVQADGIDQLTVTVTVRDEFGNPVSGSIVEIEADPIRPENDITNPPGATNEDGIAIGYVKSTYAEQKIIRALINSVQATQTLTVDFESGDVSASESGISAVPSPVTANGTDTLFVTVTARDANGNPVAGRNVSLTVDPQRLEPENVIIDPAVPTDSNGEAIGYVLSRVAEIKTIGAVIGGITIDGTVAVDFEPGPHNLSESGISVAPSEVTADGDDTLYVTVTVRDAFGNPVPDREVTLSASGTGNAIEDPISWTDANGRTVGYIFSTVAESKTIGFSIESEVADSTAAALFVAGPVDLANSLIEVSPPTVTADGIEELDVTVTARDSNDNPVEGESVTIEVEPARPENMITQPPVPTNAAGQAFGSARSTYAELKTIRARIGGALMPASETAQFVAGDVDHFIITHDGTATAGAPEDVTIEVRDENDNRLESFTGTVTVYTSTSETEDRISWDALPALGTIVSQSGDSADYQFAPGDNGIATLRITDLAAESITIYATDGTVTSASATQLVVGHAAADSIFTISGDGQTAVVQQAVASPLVIGVEDQYGNRVQGETVTFTILDGVNAEIDTDLSLPGIQLTAVTDANGTAECEYWKLGEVSGIDSDRVEASITAGATTTATFIATAVHDEIASIVLDPGDRSFTVGASDTVTATARDQYGNFVVDEYVQIFLKAPVYGTLSEDPAHETDDLGPSARAGDTDGSGRIYVIYNAPLTAGLQDVLDASHADLPASSVTDVVYTSVAEGATKLRVTIQDGETSHAGETFTFLVEAVDDNGNLDPSDESHIILDSDPLGGFTFSLTDFGTTVTTADLSGGSVTLYGRGSYTGTWNIDVHESTNSLDSDAFSISITAEDAVDHYAVTTPPSVTAGSDFTVHAEAQDRFNNLVTTANYAIALHAVDAVDTGQPASAELNKTTGDVVNGVYTETAMRYTVAEDIRIEITGGVPVTAYSDPISFSHASAFQIVKVSGDATGVPADDQVTLTARVDDKYGNPVNGADVTFTRQTGGGSPASATLPTGADGEVSLLYTTGTTAGENIVRAAILDGDPPGTETQDFTITTVPQTGVETVTIALPGTAFQAGEHFTVDIEAFDAYGNKLVNDFSSQLVPIALNPSMTFIPDEVTLSVGEASFDATDTQVGTNRIAIRSLGGDTLSEWSPVITISHTDAFSIIEVSGDSTGVIAGTSVQLKARVRDEYGNNVGGEIVQFSITSNLGGDPELIDIDGDTSDGRVRTSSEGIAVCSLTTDINTGDNTVDAAILDGNPPEQRKTFTVSTMAGTISRYDVIPDGYTKLAGESFTVTITAYDLNDNIATDDNTTQVDLSSNGSAVFSEDPVTLTAGTSVVTVSDEVAEQLVISAETLGGGALSHSAEIMILPEVPAGVIAIESITPNDTLTANGISKSTITTSPIVDQYGNIVSTGTMITVSAALGEVASEDRDETTPGVQRATGVNGRVSVFILSDASPGSDTITFQSVEGSATGSAALVYAPGPDCQYADYIDPEFVVPDNTARFRCLVRNFSETGLWLSASSTISFSDPVGYTYTSPLETTVFLGALQADTLDFSPATVPTGMQGGTYSPEVNLLGTDIYGSSYSARFNAGVNSITVSTIEIASITNPGLVSRGDTVEVGIEVRNNSSGSYVVVQEIDLHFSESNSVLVGGLEDWDPPLPDTLLGDTEKTYRGRVAVSLDYIGGEYIDASVIARTDGIEVRDPSADDAQGIWTIQSAAQVYYMTGSLAPMTVSQGQEQSFSLSLRNDGQAGVFLDPLATVMIFTDGINPFIVYPAEALALPGNATTSITFPAELVPAAMDPGLKRIDLVLRGTENGGYYDESLMLSDSVLVTTPALVSYVPGSLDPSTVSRGSSVSFEIGVQNSGSASVECTADSTWITFGSGTYRADLDRNRETTIAPETTTQLYFVSEEIPEGLVTGSYTADVRIFGTENGLPFEVLLTPSDQISIEYPSLLSINSITVSEPATITADQISPWSAEMIVENNGEASVRLDSLELRLFNGALDVLGEVEITPDFVAGTILEQYNSASITFEFSDDIGNPMTVGTVVIDATVWGTDLNSQQELTANTEKGGKGSYTVQTPAELVVLDILPSVERASAGQTRDWTIDVAIRNNGQSNIDISFDTDSTYVAFSTSGDFLVIRPTQLMGGGTVLEGLSTDTLRFIVDQTGTVNGDCTINASVGGTETNSMRLLPLASNSAQVDVQSEAVLVINSLTALQDPVTLSQTREWSIEMEVTNIGQSDVTIDPLRTDSTWVTIPAGTGFGFEIDNPAGFVSGGTSLGGGDTKLLRFTVSTTGSEPPGSQEITGAIYAIENNSGRPVYAERSGSDYVTLQRRPDTEYFPHSLTPTVVSSGTSVSIGIDIASDDPDHSTLRLDPDNTTVSFSDGEGDTYMALLSPQSVDTLAGGESSDLTFESAVVDPAIALQSYSVAIHLEGTENGNFFEANLETGPDDSLKVEDASQLSINGFVLSQQSITAGQTREWQARMIVQNNGEAAVDLDLDPARTRLAFIIGGSTVTGEYTISYPTELVESGSDTLYGGETDTLVFAITESGTTDGMMFVHGYIEGIDINSKELLSDNTFEGGWATMDVQLAGDPRVAATTPERETVTSGQTTPWTFTVTVCNDGEAELTLSADSTLIHQLDPMYTIEYDWGGEFEGGGTSLSGGECRDIIFTVSPTIDRPNGEDLLLYPRAGFFEDNSGEYREYDTGLTGEGFGEIRVEAPADLSIARVENAAPRSPYVNMSQRFPIVFEIENNGEATAGQISVSLTSDGVSSIEDAPVILTELAGSGGTAVDTFHIIASDITGAEIFTAAIDSAVDVNSGQSDLVLTSPSPDDTAHAEIQAPGALVVTRLVPSQDEVNQGQVADWDLTAHVENMGEAPVLLDTPSEADIVFRIDGVQQTDYDVDVPTGFASGNTGFVLAGYAADSLIYTVTRTGYDVGTVDIWASLDWWDTNEPDIAKVAAFADTTVNVTRPSGLRIKRVTSDAPNNELYPNTSVVDTGQVFNLRVTVENTGGDNILDLEVVVASNNGTEAEYVGLPYPSILSGDSLNFDFRVTASGNEEVEILTASIVNAISENTGETVPPLQADENTENIIVQLPALLSVDAWISDPEGAMDGTVSVGQEFVLTSRVVNEGTASVDASGQVTLALPTNMALVDSGSEPFVRSFMPGADISWRINAPDDPSPGDDLLVTITNPPVDINIDPLPAAISDIDDTVTVVTVDVASIDIADLYFESPDGAMDGILSTEQDFTVAARFTASVNCDSVRLELVLPTGFTPSNGLVQYVGAGTGVEDTLRWNVTAPADEVLSETIRVIPRGKDRYSGSSFTDQDETTPIQVVRKAELELTYDISGPEDAMDYILSVGLVFTVTADVANLGTAGVDTSGARLVIELPSGYSLSGVGETFAKTFYPSVPVTWSLQAPGEPQPTPVDITVTFLGPYATDENTGESADLIEDQNPISVVTEEGQLEMTNLSDIDTIPPYVVPQGAEDVPVLRAGLKNGSTYTVGLDTLYITVEKGGGEAVEDPSRYVTSIDLVTGQGTFSATVQNENPVPIIVDHAYLLSDAVSDTLLMEVDIAGNAPAGELRFDIAVSDDIIFTIVDGSRIRAVWAGDGGDIAGHFLSGPLSVMSKDFEEYVHNYPNPFQAGSESTRIAYFMTEDASVSIKIYDLMGNLVFTKDIPAGEPGASGTADGTWCETEWDGRNNRGEVVRNGVYLCQIQAGSRSTTFKIAVAK